MHSIKIPQVKDYETIDFRQVEKGEEYIAEITQTMTRIETWRDSKKSHRFYWIIKRTPTLRDASPNDFPGFSRDCEYSLNGNHWLKGTLHGIKVAPELSFWVQCGLDGDYFWTKYCRIEENSR